MKVSRRRVLAALGSFTVAALGGVRRLSAATGNLIYSITPTVSGPQTIVSITPTTVSFVGGAGSANTHIVTFIATMSPASPAFAGTWSIGGTNASSFVINPTTGALTVGSSDVLNGSYSIIVFAVQSGASGSPFSQVVSLTGTTQVALFPTVTYDTVINVGAVFYVDVTSPPSRLGASNGPIAQVVSGTITIDGFWFDNSGGTTHPTSGQATLQWLLDGVPIVSGPSGYLSAGGPEGHNGTYAFDTTAYADGTHWLSCKFIDNTGVLPAFLLFPRPMTIIINNHGLITGSQTIPITGLSFNYRVLPNQADYVTFPGVGSLPAHNTPHPYPTQFIPPVNSPSNPYHTHPADLDIADNWYTENTTERTYGEYQGSPHFYTTQNGGVFAQEYLPQMGGGDTIDQAYDGTIRAQNYDGGANDNMISPFSVGVETPDGSGYTCIDLAQTVFTLSHVGARNTIFGQKANRGVLPLDPNDLTIDTSQIVAQQTFVGQVSGNIGYASSAPFVFDPDSPGGDICYDPRDSTHKTIYYSAPDKGAIIKLDFTTTPVTATIYAGIYGTPGFVNGPALGGSISTNAQFGYPTSIIMWTDGTMYVADATNNCVRKITSLSLGVPGTVSTFVGVQPGASEATLAIQQSIVGGISDGGGVNPGTLLDMTSGSIIIGQELLTPYVPNDGTLITSQISGPVGGPGRYQLSGSAQHVAAGSTMIASNIGIYSPPGTVPFSSANLTYPFVIRFFSDGAICLGEPDTGCIREINLSAQTVRRINYFGSGPLFPNTPHTWFWLDVDNVGACGVVDRIHYGDFDTWGSAEIQNQASRDGTVKVVINKDGGIIPEGRVSTYGSQWDQAHYPWNIIYSKTQARRLTAGQAVGGVFAWRPVQTVTGGGITADPPFDPLNTGAGLDVATYRRGQAIWDTGSIPEFPYGARPSFRLLMGPMGVGHLGVGPTIDDLMVTYPIPATPGTGSDPAFAAYLQGGAWGSVPRPEITGNDMRDLIYFIRRTSLAGTWPTNPVPGANDPDTGNLPVISAVTATRLSSTSIRVTWTTNKATLGLAAGGSANSQGSNAKYNVWSPIETSYGTSHNVVISGLPLSSPTHYAVLSTDTAGNYASSPDMTVI